MPVRILVTCASYIGLTVAAVPGGCAATGEPAAPAQEAAAAIGGAGIGAAGAGTAANTSGAGARAAAGTTSSIGGAGASAGTLAADGGQGGVWTYKTTLPKPLHGTGAVGYGGKYYLFGGAENPSSATPRTGIVHILTP